MSPALGEGALKSSLYVFKDVMVLLPLPLVSLDACLNPYDWCALGDVKDRDSNALLSEAYALNAAVVLFVVGVVDEDVLPTPNTAGLTLYFLARF